MSHEAAVPPWKCTFWAVGILLQETTTGLSLVVSTYLEKKHSLRCGNVLSTRIMTLVDLNTWSGFLPSVSCVVWEVKKRRF